jgi:uncharacterized membrane protein
MTNLSEINIFDGLENPSQRPISVEEIARHFYGITLIHFVRENTSNKILVSVHTKNKGSVYISNLYSIQKTLGATTMSISAIPIAGGFDGLIYVLGYAL